MGTADDPDTRRGAAAALGRIGGLRATTALKAALRDIDLAVRMEAVEALGAVGGPRAADALLEALESADLDIRGLALQQLVKSREPRVLPVLVTMAKNPRSRLRRAAVTALGAFREPTAVGVLYEALGDSDRGLSDLAAGALGKIGGVHAVGRLLRVRSAASMRALGRIGHPSAMEGLVQALGHVRDASVRAGAAQALRELDRAHPGLHLGGLAATEGEVELLASCSDPRAVAPLCGWLFATAPSDRITAARGLARLGDSSIAGILQELLRDPVPEVCLAAADALRAIAPDRDWDPLSETIVFHMGRISELGSNSAATDDLLASIDFLTRLGATLALPTLHGLEGHPDFSVRNAVQHALRSLGGTR